MENTYLIVGLGNPGREYARTRHNAGFMVVAELAERWKVSWKDEKKFRSRLARYENDGRTIWLCQPQTFMNCSGEAIGAMAQFYRIAVGQILVSVDDADLPFGEVRLRARGSSGGHHGLESIEEHLGTRDFARQRIGIGRTEAGVREITGHVLGSFRGEEQGLLEQVLQRAVNQAHVWLSEGIEPAMTRFNGRI